MLFYCHLHWPFRRSPSSSIRGQTAVQSADTEHKLITARATRYEAARLYMCRNRSLVSPFTRPRRPLREKKNATMKLRPILAAFSLNFIAYSPELTSEKMEAKALGSSMMSYWLSFSYFGQLNICAVQQAGIFSRADDDAVQHQHYSSAPINAIPTSSIFICHLIPAFHLTGRPRSHESINPCVLLQRLTGPHPGSFDPLVLCIFRPLLS